MLITGGSEGIGFALAKCFARDGYEIVLNGRNEEKLNRAKEILEREYSVSVQLIPMDLSVKGSAEELYHKAVPLDVLVNNAGCGYAGRVWDGDPDAEEDMVVLNDVSLMTLSRLFLKDHARTHDGILLNTASTGAFQPGPYIASYYASKSFVVSFTEAAAYEAKKYGVKVHCLCPGPVDTAFYEKSKGHHPRNAMSVSKCAEYAYRRMGRRKVILIPGISDRLMKYLPAKLKMHAVGMLKRRYLSEEADH